ncbi:MAG: DUF4129 domain-containing protein [Leptolyngbyaceae cyanobacterium CRU_2_3]|nr:DUF4129 domain-containing protein [Leptolyngbyaceae cyanobacterium CRU_2_3]
MAGTFEKTNLDWQIQQLQWQFGEWLERLLASNSDFPSGDDWQIPQWLLRGLFWLIVMGLASFLGWQSYKLFRPYLAESWRLRRSPSPPAPSSSKTLAVAEWLQQSRQAQQQGNYREACRFLYQAMLQRLNDENLICQDLSRTDGEYVALLHSLSTLDRPQPYQILLRTHERLCFSKTPISAEICDRCWQAYREIDSVESPL